MTTPPDASAVDLGRLYAAARERITDLVLSAGPTASNTPVAGTPGWSVHDVVAHVSGIVEDALAGNMAGAPGDAWTAAQVERGRKREVVDMLSQWSDQAPMFEGFLSSGDNDLSGAAVIDIHSHEHDLRGALDAPAALTEPFARWALPVLVANSNDSAASLGLPPLRLVTDEGDDLGPADTPTVWRVPRFEAFRSTLGRRSPAQIAAYPWDVPPGHSPADYVPALCIFGPRTEPLVEARP